MPLSLSPAHVLYFQAAVDAMLASPAKVSAANWARGIAATVGMVVGARHAVISVAPAGEAVHRYGDGRTSDALCALADPERLPAVAVGQSTHDVATWVLAAIAGGQSSDAAAGLQYESTALRVHCAWLLPGPLGDDDARRTRVLLDLLAPVFAAGGRARAHAGLKMAPTPSAVGPVDPLAADALACALGDNYALTARETQVAGHLLRGGSNAQLAAALGISLSTARHHTERVLAKLGVRSRAEVAWQALGRVRVPAAGS